MNDRKEFVGSVMTFDAQGFETSAKWIYYARQRGLMDLQKLVNLLKKNVKILKIADLNDAGQIFPNVQRSDKSAPVILTPAN